MCKPKLATCGASTPLFLDGWLISRSVHKLLKGPAGTVCHGFRGSSQGHHMNLVGPDGPWHRRDWE